MEFVVSDLCGDTEAPVGATDTCGKGQLPPIFCVFRVMEVEVGQEVPPRSTGSQDRYLCPSRDPEANTGRHFSFSEGIKE